MVRQNLRSILALGALLIAVPFIYNSCQSAFRAAGVDSLSSAECVAGASNTSGTTVNRTASKPPLNPFASGKVVLNGADAQNQARSRAAQKSLTNPPLENLAAIINTDCVSDRKNSGEDPALAEDIIGNAFVEPSLHRQVFAFSTSLDAATLSQSAQDDECVVGISFNHQYKKSSLTLNDPGMSQQVQLTSMNAIAAYNNFFNDTYGIQATNTSLTDTLVAVIDSGVDYSHADLGSKIQQYLLPGGGIGWGVDATTIGTNLVNYNPIDVSPEGHGTHVAGIIGALTGNGVGIVGTAPYRTRIMAVKVFQADGSTTDATTVANGIEFAIRNKADIVNMSLQETFQGTNSDTILQYEIQQLIAANIVVVMAMGNGSDSVPAGLVDGTNLTVIPAYYAKGNPGVIAVASVDTQLVNGSILKSTFSHWGPDYAKIAAYGAQNSQSTSYTGIYSTLPTGLSGSSSGYGYLAGTSMAAPQVSAAAALIITILRDRTGTKPTPAEVERLLLAGSKKNANLTSYIQDGNTLDLSMLFDTIARNYPQTADPTYRSTLCPGG